MASNLRRAAHPLDPIDEFERRHPWELLSPGCLADIHEVRRLGARVTRARTADQTAAAIFWNASPVVPWSAAARAVALGEGGDARDAAVIVASVARVIAQSLLLARRFKERSWNPRPQALIRGEASSRAVSFDPEWESLLETPADSEAPCAGCLAAGAAAGVLRQVMQADEIEVTVTYPLECGLTRRFHTVSEMLQESEDARIWAGLHLRATVVESTEMGLRFAGFQR